MGIKKVEQLEKDELNNNNNSNDNKDLDTIKNKMHLNIDNFEGPLDLLCYLIEDKKLDIYEVSISQITEQYLKYLDLMRTYNLDIASEFLLMASYLIYLKSKGLLPKVEDEIDEEEELRQRIIKYRLYKNNLPSFRETFEDNSRKIFKSPEKMFFDKIEFEEEYELKELEKAYKKILFKVNNRKNENARNVEKIAIKDRYTVKSKVVEIFKAVLNKGKIVFNNMFSVKKKDKEEVVTGFLAMLELSRREKINISQKKNFGDIIIEKNSNVNIEKTNDKD